MRAEGYAKLGQADEALSCLAEAAQIIEVTMIKPSLSQPTFDSGRSIAASTRH